MQVVCNKTSIHYVGTKEVTPVWAHVFKDHTYTVCEVEERNGVLMYFLEERPPNCAYVARNFDRLDDVLSEISIEELIKEEVLC